MATNLARGSASAFAVYVAGAGVTYCAQLAIARVIGAEGYGIYAYVFAWVSLSAYASALGFNVSLMRFVPAYQAQQAWSHLRGVIQYASRRTIAAGCGVAVIGSAIVLNRAADLPPELATTFLIGLALVPILASLWVRSAVVRALGGVVSALAPDRLVRDVVLLGLIGLASVGAWRMADAPSAMAATVIGAAAGLGLVSFAMHRLMPSAAVGSTPAYEARIWRRTALPLV
ncbi:MAG: oligosaccharide flippase family protein, partial [Stellaceae bacterium]